MPFDLTADKINTFLGVNDAPREPAPSKAGNGAHLVKQHNSLVDNFQNIANHLSQSLDNFRSEVSNELMFDRNEIAELTNTLATIPIATQAFLATSSHIASSGQKIVFADFYTDGPLTLFLPVNPAPGAEITFMHMNSDQPLWIKNENQDIFKFQGRPKYEMHLVPVYEMVSLIFVGFSSAHQIEYNWVPTNNTAFIDPSAATV